MANGICLLSLLLYMHTCVSSSFCLTIRSDFLASFSLALCLEQILIHVVLDIIICQMNKCKCPFLLLICPDTMC